MPPASTIGVDLGGTTLLAGRFAPDMSVQRRVQRLVGGLSLEQLLDTLAAAVEEVAEDEEIDAVGIGIPSLIDSRTGLSVRCVHLPLDGVAFGDTMEQRLGRPVAVENDANCATFAEWRAGAAAGADHVVMLTLGTGIGGGLVLGGQLYRGAVGAGAELGHMTVDLDGPPCFGGCPNRGCLEALASGSALARDAAEAVARHPDSGLARMVAAGRGPDGALVTEAARGGDPVAGGLLDALGTKLGVGLAALTMALNPEVIVVGGGVAGAGELLLGPARRELARRAMSPSRDVVQVREARFGMAAGMTGAAMLAREAVA